MVLIEPAPSGALVHEIDELLGFGRGEVDVVRGAVPAGDADCEPASPGAEGGLALSKCAQGARSSEFRHDDRRYATNGYLVIEPCGLLTLRWEE